MALFHLAYTFDFEAFHEQFRQRVVISGKLDLLLLKREAKAIIERAGDRQQKILRELKFDRSWLEDPDKDGSYAHYWYLINLADNLTPCPSLSTNRYVYSHLVLEVALPIIRWKKDQVRKLIFGNFIGDTLQNVENQQLLPYVTSYGGILSSSDIFELLKSIEEFNEALFDNSDVLLALEFISSASHVDAVDLLKNALLDARDMLTTALDRSEWLYMIRDS